MVEVGTFQHIAEAAAQVGGVFVGAEVAVLEMVYHLWQAADGEAHARQSAGHSLDDGVGEVVAQGGHSQHIAGSVECADAVVVIHGTYGDEVSLAFAGGFVGAEGVGAVAHDDEVEVHIFRGFHKVLDTLLRVGGLVGYEENERPVGRESEFGAGIGLAAGGIVSCVDGVGDGADVVLGNERRLAGKPGEPFAATDEMNGWHFRRGIIGVLLACVCLSCQSWGERAAVALRPVTPRHTLVGVMAHTGEGPHIVHRPYQRLAALADAPYVGQ